MNSFVWIEREKMHNEESKERKGRAKQRTRFTYEPHLLVFFRAKNAIAHTCSCSLAFFSCVSLTSYQTIFFIYLDYIRLSWTRKNMKVPMMHSLKKKVGQSWKSRVDSEEIFIGCPPHIERKEYFLSTGSATLQSDAWMRSSILGIKALFSLLHNSCTPKWVLYFLKIVLKLHNSVPDIETCKSHEIAQKSRNDKEVPAQKL